VVLAAGGTAGHVFPAQAIYERLLANGTEVHLLTDDRGLRWADGFAPEHVRVIPSGGIVTGSIPTRTRNAAKLTRGYFRARVALLDLQPDAVLGMGGYAAVGPLVSAQRMAIPTLLHEQNSVMGLANRAAARSADVIALSFDPTEGAKGECIVTGNPSRPDVIEVGAQPYPTPTEGGPLELLVIGGSQGARSISIRIPSAIAHLDETLRARLRVVHQARTEDHQQVTDTYERAGVAAEVLPFVDVPETLTHTHLVLGRSGATTVCDVAVARRPGLYLPLTSHTDLQQVKNARAVTMAGGALIHREDESTVQDLRSTLEDLLSNPGRLNSMAAAAFAWSRPDAADAILGLINDRIAPLPL